MEMYHNAGNHLIEGADVIWSDVALTADLVNEARHEANDSGSRLSANDMVASESGFIIRTITVDGTVGNAGTDAIVLSCRPLQSPSLAYSFNLIKQAWNSVTILTWLIRFKEVLWETLLLFELSRILSDS